MSSDLKGHINIGNDTENKLIQAGIDSYKKLVATGAEQAFLRVQTIDPGACLSFLYGLEGAITDTKWNELPADRKQELIHFYNLARKNSPDCKD
jgi:DNA transformation protein